jgi:hypothetical protein
VSETILRTFTIFSGSAENLRNPPPWFPRALYVITNWLSITASPVFPSKKKKLPKKRPEMLRLILVIRHACYWKLSWCFSIWMMGEDALSAPVTIQCTISVTQSKRTDFNQSAIAIICIPHHFICKYYCFL